MSQNHHHTSPDCAACAPLLPLAAQHLLSQAEEARLHAHLAGCAWCRAELTMYAQVETALRRSFAQPQEARLPFSKEELMHILDAHPDQAPEQPTPSVPTTPPIVPARPSRPARRVLAGLPALAAVLAIVLVAVLLFNALAHKTPSVASTPTAARGSDTQLLSIAMVSPTEGWAVGHATPANNPNAPTVVLMHYTHGVWSAVPTTLQGQLESISMDSATDGWAAGTGTNGTGSLLLHYDGKTWRQVASPDGMYLHRIQMLSATDGWGVDTAADATHYTGIWHYDGQNWKAQPLPASLSADVATGIQFESISMISPTEGWIVGATLPKGDKQAPDGSYYATQPPDALILHYNQGHWTLQSTLKGADLQSVSMTSAGDGWAVGATDTYTPITVDGQPNYEDQQAPLLLHYSNGEWQNAPLPTYYRGANPNSFSEVFMSSTRDGWLNAGINTASSAPNLLHYDGAAWQQITLPSLPNARYYAVFTISMLSAAEGWAVGAAFSKEANGLPNPQGPGYIPTITPVILHYHHNTWSLYQS
jgi:hypothetical protein